MENNTILLTSANYQQIKPTIDILVSQYKPLHLICFGCHNTVSNATSCFSKETHHHSFRYFLLMITESITRIEHDVQDLVNRNNKEGQVIIFVHGLETVNNAIAQGSRFFIGACRHGFHLYSADGLRFTIKPFKLNPATTLASAEKHYQHRLKMATGFFAAAEECFKLTHYNNCIFMLHQAVEQACIGIIRVYLAYRSDIHNLGRLLLICTSFSEQPAAIFPQNTAEEQRLFRLLQVSYSDARYRDHYQVSTEDTELLCTKVSDFLVLTATLCQARLKEYRLAVDNEEQVFDFLPALPASLNA